MPGHRASDASETGIRLSFFKKLLRTLSRCALAPVTRITEHSSVGARRATQLPANPLPPGVCTIAVTLMAMPAVRSGA